MAKRSRRAQRPLQVTVDRDVVTITIGIRTLVGAVELGPDFQHYDEAAAEFYPPKVTDASVFAAAVCAALAAEEEDGTTLVHIAFDKAALSAIESGAEGVLCYGDAGYGDAG